MSLVLTIVAWAALALIGIAALVCLTPLRLEVAVGTTPALSVRWALRPFGGFGPRMPLPKPGRRPGKPTKAKKPQPRPRLPHLRTGRAALRFLQDLVPCIRIVDLRCKARIGLGDPAETGQVFGLLAPIVYALPPSPRCQINLVPDFEAEVLEGDANLVLSLVPARLAGPLARLGWQVFGPAR